MSQQSKIRSCKTVGIIGYGPIGRVLANELLTGYDGLVFGGAVGRRAPDGIRCASVDELIERCDVIVEAASQEAVEEHGRRILRADRDLLVLSVGAFADERLLREFESLGAGRVTVSTGAIGGVDLLKAAALSGQLDEVGITTTKPIAAFVDAEDLDPARAPTDRPDAFTVFEGTAREVVVRFPASTNVAATVGLCTLGMDRVKVRLIADPAADVVAHRLQASGQIGTYDFTIVNHASENPRTSSITAYAALRALLDEQARIVIA
jgi:aspartate dehydrogenase